MMAEFAKERDAAFTDFVLTGNTVKVKKYCKKYNVPMPKNKKVFAGDYKEAKHDKVQAGDN